jgi:large subunit ribosomal protein L24
MQHIRKNDTVVLLKDFSGPQPARKGTTARVLKVFAKEATLICEGVNLKHKHIRANTNRDYPRGGIIRKEAPISVSNVALYCGKCEKGTRVTRKLVEGKKVRVCKKCGEPIEAAT